MKNKLPIIRYLEQTSENLARYRVILSPSRHHDFNIVRGVSKDVAAGMAHGYAQGWQDAKRDEEAR